MNVLSSIHKNFDLQNNHAAELSYTYNNWRKVSRRKEEFTAQNAPTVADYEYTYSKGLHLIGKRENTENRRTAYQYDSYYRLRRVDYNCAYDADDPTCIENRSNVFKCNAAESGCEDFQLDGVHNIRSSYENQTNFAWTVDGFNRLRDKKVGGNTAVEYDYDERNNMISEDRSGTTDDRTYIYDDLNRLIEVKDGSNQTIAAYTYDAFNRRITKTVGSTTERYTYDDWDIVEISTNSNDYTNIIDSGTDRHIAIEVTSNNISTLYYFLTDERGNVTALTDESGNILERYRYRVYGDFEILDAQFSPKNCNNQTCYATNLHNFLWGGSLYEPETNLYWMRNRYYHIDMHRFINQDPIGIWGDANNLGNGFAYVAGMVIEASDPTGLDILWTSTQSEIMRKTFQYSIYRGDTVEIASAKAEIAGILASLRTEPPENVFDYAGTLADILGLVSALEEEYNIWEKEKEPFLWNIGKSEDPLKSTKYTNAQTGETKYEFDDGTIVYVSKQGNMSCTGPSCEKLGFYPSEPGSTDSVQTYFANQFIKKILEMHEKKSFLEIMEEEGAVIKYDDNGKKVFIFNPYYRGKDPMKQIFWETKTADGTTGFIRNPFAPGAEYGYDSTTYERWQQSGFIQPNIDPYFE